MAAFPWGGHSKLGDRNAMNLVTVNQYLFDTIGICTKLQRKSMEVFPLMFSRGAMYAHGHHTETHFLPNLAENSNWKNL